ncbi:FAD-dependent oxidoreductase [Nonomuraea antimicrobica]
MRRKPRVVVVGAGFAGLAATRELARHGALVTLVDRNAYATFHPSSTRWPRPGWARRTSPTRSGPSPPGGPTYGRGGPR